MDYRKRIYDRYATSRGVENGRPPREIVARRFRYLDYKLGDWVPGDKASSVLDLGCGSGLFMRYLLDRGFTDVTGVDVSPEQVAAARVFCSEAEVLELDLFDYLKGNSREFDFIASLDVIEHIPKAMALEYLDLIRGALKPGGSLLLQTPNALSPLGMGVRYGDFTHETCFAPDSLGQLLDVSGFASPEFRECGPAPLGVKSGIRFILWKSLSLGIDIYNLVETGGRGHGINTRVFMARGLKRNEDNSDR